MQANPGMALLAQFGPFLFLIVMSVLMSVISNNGGATTDTPSYNYSFLQSYSYPI